MPIIKSAKKRVRVAKRQSIENARTKKEVKAAIKSFEAAVATKKNIEAAQSSAYGALDTAVKKGIITKNKAARKKSQLNLRAKAVSGGKKKTATKKTATKKTASKAAKKPAAKKKPASKIKK